MKNNRTPEEQIAWLQYGLQACRKLEVEFLDLNDLDSAAYFRLRQKQINKELKNHYGLEKTITKPQLN